MFHVFIYYLPYEGVTFKGDNVLKGDNHATPCVL